LRRIIRHPANKRNLAPLPLARSLILDIEDRIPAPNPLDAGLVLALGAQQLLAEFAVVGVGGGLFDDDLFPVVADFVDDPFGAFAEFQLVEGLDAFGGYGDSGRVGWLVWVRVLGVVEVYPDCAWRGCVLVETFYYLLTKLEHTMLGHQFVCLRYSCYPLVVVYDKPSVQFFFGPIHAGS
jgi:hypothetical protein